MKRYEKELPQGYTVIKTVDMKDNKKAALLMNVAALVIMIPAFAIPLLIYLLSGNDFDFSSTQVTAALFSVALGSFIYIILHELAHGIAYKCLTRERLTFGVSLSCAYCGVPNIYTYRRTALIAVSLPLIFFSVLFIGVMAVTYFIYPLAYLIFALLFALHLGGCSGDIYVTYLLLRHKDDTILMNDTGPKMTIYKYIEKSKIDRLKIAKISDCEFDFIYKELEKNFIRDERRDYCDAKAVLANKKYSVYHIIDGEERIGFITLWHLSEFTFAEHFVIYEKYRNRGYGGLALSLLKNEFGSIVLEAEPPISDMQKRRIGFYRRNGFLTNDVPYIQPSYHKDGAGVELLLMSYPERLENVSEAVSEIYKTVYNK